MKGNQENNPTHFSENLESRSLNDLESAQLRKIKEFFVFRDERAHNKLTNIEWALEVVICCLKDLRIVFKEGNIEVDEIKVADKMPDVGEMSDANEIPVAKEREEKEILATDEIKKLAKYAESQIKDLESNIKAEKKKRQTPARLEKLAQLGEVIEGFKKALEKINNSMGGLGKADAPAPQTPEAKKVFNQILSKVALLFSFIYGGRNVFSGGGVASTRPKMNATQDQEEVEMVALSHSEASTSGRIRNSNRLFQEFLNRHTNGNNGVPAHTQDSTAPIVPYLRS